MKQTPLSALLEPAVDALRVEAGHTYPMVGVRSFGGGLFERDPLDGGSTSYTKLHRLHGGDVVLSRLFGWEGAIAMVPSQYDGYFVSSEFPTFRVNSDTARPQFVKHLCVWPGLWERMASVARGVGVRRRRVHVEDFLGLHVPVPDLESQASIACWLDAVTNEARAAESMLADAAHRYGQLLSSLVHRLDLSPTEKGQLGWRRMPIGSFTTPVDRREEVSEEVEYPIAGVYSFGRGLLRRPTLLGAETKYKHLSRLATGDFVFSKLGAWEGALAVVPKEFDGHYVSTEFPIFEVNETVASRDYLRALVSTPEVRRLVDEATHGSMARRRRVRPSEMSKIAVELPPLDGQLAIADDLARLRRIGQSDSRREMLEALVPSTINTTFANLA